MKKTISAKNLAFCALWHRAVRGAADGVPRDRECGPDLPADAYSRAAVRTGLRVAVRPRLRRAGAGAVRRADGDACPRPCCPA